MGGTIEVSLWLILLQPTCAVYETSADSSWGDVEDKTFFGGQNIMWVIILRGWRYWLCMSYVYHNTYWTLSRKSANTVSSFVLFCPPSRTQAEMGHTCRGTIPLATAHIELGDACHLLITNGGRSYHLKATSEAECQHWLSTLQQAKVNANSLIHHSGKACTLRYVSTHGWCCLMCMD